MAGLRLGLALPLLTERGGVGRAGEHVLHGGEEPLAAPVAERLAAGVCPVEVEPVDDPSALGGEDAGAQDVDPVSGDAGGEVEEEPRPVFGADPEDGRACGTVGIEAESAQCGRCGRFCEHGHSGAELVVVEGCPVGIRQLGGEPAERVVGEGAVAERSLHGRAFGEVGRGRRGAVEVVAGGLVEPAQQLNLPGERTLRADGGGVGPGQDGEGVEFAGRANEAGEGLDGARVAQVAALADACEPEVFEDKPSGEFDGLCRKLHAARDFSGHAGADEAVIALEGLAHIVEEGGQANRFAEPRFARAEVGPCLCDEAGCGGRLLVESCDAEEGLEEVAVCGVDVMDIAAGVANEVGPFRHEGAEQVEFEQQAQEAAVWGGGEDGLTEHRDGSRVDGCRGLEFGG